MNTTPKIIASNENIDALCKKEIRTLGKYANLNHIDVSRVTKFTQLFKVISNDFQGDISEWDFSGMSSGTYMFESSNFNNPITIKRIGHVNLEGMFVNSSFNQPVSNWELIAPASKRDAMFYASSFSQPDLIGSQLIDYRNMGIQDINDVLDMELQTLWLRPAQRDAYIKRAMQILKETPQFTNTHF